MCAIPSFPPQFIYLVLSQVSVLSLQRLSSSSHGILPAAFSSPLPPPLPVFDVRSPHIPGMIPPEGGMDEARGRRCLARRSGLMISL